MISGRGYEEVDMEVFMIVVIPIAIVLGIFGGIFVIGEYIIYRNNTAFETIYLNGKKIYSAMSRNVGWEQLGEVGNKYSVVEYKIGFWNKLFKRKINYWVGDNLQVKNKADKFCPKCGKRR